jgi:hypothetical protein
MKAGFLFSLISPLKSPYDVVILYSEIKKCSGSSSGHRPHRPVKARLVERGKLVINPCKYDWLKYFPKEEWLLNAAFAVFYHVTQLQ